METSSVTASANSAHPNASSVRLSPFQRPTIQAPAAMPVINVINMSEKACVLEPNTNASIRVQTTSYNIATNPETPMPTTASVISCGVNFSSPSLEWCWLSWLRFDPASPSLIQPLTKSAMTPTTKFNAAPANTVDS